MTSQLMRTLNSFTHTVGFLPSWKNDAKSGVALVTGQIANEIESIGTQLEHLYGVLDEETLKFR